MYEDVAARLYARRCEAVIPMRARVQGRWQPQHKECHTNAEIWCHLNPNYRQVRGWLVADYEDIGLYKFFSHSVVEDATGSLVDITPNPLPYSYPFLRHDPADGDYSQFEHLTFLTHEIS